MASVKHQRCHCPSRGDSDIVHDFNDVVLDRLQDDAEDRAGHLAVVDVLARLATNSRVFVLDAILNVQDLLLSLVEFFPRAALCNDAAHRTHLVDQADHLGMRSVHGLLQRVDAVCALQPVLVRTTKHDAAQQVLDHFLLIGARPNDLVVFAECLYPATRNVAVLNVILEGRQLDRLDLFG